MEEHPIVKIKQGTLRGKVNSDYQGNRYYSFQGIPYAEPPIGDLRFKAPQPPKRWDGTRDAAKEGSVSYSKDFFSNGMVGSEDCLFLNVYTPQLPSENAVLKSVMVWIHGGAFLIGSGNSNRCGPDFLLTEGVVVVTINYRLGLLGFLSFDDPSLEVTGNAGFKDQVMALKWIRDNISYFGGNSNSVTIFGASSGATSVHCLILSPMAKGLFHNAIMHSGCALCPFGQIRPQLPSLKEYLKLKTEDAKEVLSILKGMSVEEIFKLQEKMADEPFLPSPRLIGLAIENPSAKLPFIRDDPMKIILSGDYNDVPIMIGYTSREGMVSEVLPGHRDSDGNLKFVTDFELEVPSIMKIARGTDLSKTISNEIQQFYYGNEVPSNDNINQFYLLKGDNFFVRETYATLKNHCATTSKPIYLFRVSVESTLNLSKKAVGITNPGVCHGDDVSYIFKNMVTKKIIANSIEDISVRRFAKLWTTFAKTGNPNPTNKDNFINVHWKPVQPELFHFLDIGDNLTLGVNPEEERMSFWKKLFALSPHSSNIL
ncbi:hypothetical protein RI129_002602 [Pyrocoelia pectoralis]|uniref:Carboxylic ester hydrolase n=1 Tax=Pyrocoelia pectoralis TaxID=417401 RepID=A0AAN7VFL9_9COLE